MPAYLYRSSAGSGKTFTLVREYLRLTLNVPENAGKNLAITFTNKATTEMKSRVLDTLGDLSRNQESDLAKKVTEDLGDAEYARKQSGELLSTLLHNYHDFSISTIDSFFTRIIRPFSRELNLPANFDIHLDEEQVIEEITDQIVKKASEDTQLREFFKGFISSNIEAGKTWNIEKTLHQAAKEILRSEDIQQKPVSLESIKNFTQTLWQIRKSFEEEMDKIGQKGKQILHNNGLDVKDFKHGKSGPASYFDKLLQSKPDYTPKKRVQEGLESSENWFKKDENPPRETLQTVEKLREVLQEAVDHYEKDFPKYQTAVVLLKNIYAFGIWQEFSKHLHDYKVKHNILPISELSKVIRQHLYKEPVPYIFSFAGLRFENFLLDEFQDTSRLQWENLLPLLENALGEGGNILMLGDTKQAIYRWRGGDPSIMEEKVQEAFQNNLEERPLDYNFRSEQKIVEFNNTFFLGCGEILQHNRPNNPAVKPFTRSVRQHPNKTDGYGLAEVYFPPKENNKTDTHNNCLEILGNKLSELEEDEFGPEDIAILVRNNNEAAEITQFLLDLNYPAISEAALYLEKHPAVRFILSLVDYLSESQPFALKEAAFIYDFYLVEEENKSSVPPELKENPVEVLPEILQQELKSLAWLPVYTALNRIVQLALEGYQNDAYLVSFMNVVHQASAEQGGGISAFRDFWKDQQYEVQTGGSEGVIRVMTLHKAKGLEFPAVIMPYADWNFTNSGNILWVNTDQEPFNQFEQLPVSNNQDLSETYFEETYTREEELQIQDNLNLLYVGFTRARERLIVMAPAGKQYDSLKNAASWIAMACDVNPENQDYFAYGVRVAKKEREPEEAEKPLSLPSVSVNDDLVPNTVIPRQHKPVGEKIQTGDLVHEALEKLKYRDQLEWVLSEFCDKDRHLPPEYREFLKNSLEKLLEVPETQEWLPSSYAARENGIQVLNEKSIITPSGSPYRPDRVVVTPDKVIVIDFKTGEHRPSHEKQIKFYGDLLEKMGYTAIEKKLVFLGEEIEIKNV